MSVLRLVRLCLYNSPARRHASPRPLFDYSLILFLPGEGTGTHQQPAPHHDEFYLLGLPHVEYLTLAVQGAHFAGWKIPKAADGLLKIIINNGKAQQCYSMAGIMVDV